MSTPEDAITQAEVINREMRAMSDLLFGAVSTLVSEGWTEEQARTIVVATFAGQAKR